MASALVFAGQAVAGGSVKDEPVGDTKRGVSFGGYDVVRDATYSFDGIIVAFNRDISKSGWALRVYGSRTDFDLDPGDGRTWQGDVMLGYLFSRNNLYGGIYFGADYANIKLSPDDPTTEARGVEWGAKVAGDITTGRAAPHYFALAGSYSTAFDSYWARLRLGLNRPKYTFGVEGSAFGNVEFDAQRLGGFLTWDMAILPRMPVEVTLSVGRQFVNDTGGGAGVQSQGGGEGTYATIVFSSAF